jgi:predicted AlkP superfamily phosphohydrolase/phosphomutase
MELQLRGAPFSLLSAQKVNDLLCISAHLYHETNNYFSEELTKYCLAYNSKLTNCLSMIYLIDEYIVLPRFIKDDLAKVEQKVLVKELWDCEEGYRMLVEGRTKANEPIFLRLDRAIHDRVVEILTQSGVSPN